MYDIILCLYQKGFSKRPQSNYKKSYDLLYTYIHTYPKPDQTGWLNVATRMLVMHMRVRNATVVMVYKI